MMEQFAIELLLHERALFSALTLHAPNNPTDYKRNGEVALQLTQSLAARDAIPEHRLRYFTDPEYNISNPKRSRQGVFERNGCGGAAILRHVHFLPHLRYFLLGANLPDSIRDAFKAEVQSCGQVTSGDLEPLKAKARTLARMHGQKPRELADEFFKLALDCGLSPDMAAFVRGAVKALR